MKHFEKHLGGYVAFIIVFVLACVLALSSCAAPTTGDSTQDKPSAQEPDTGSDGNSDSNSSPDSDAESNANSGQGQQSGPNANSSNKGTGEAVQVGQEAPDFEFAKTDGTTGKLSDYRGKVVQLNFWATWCGYCVQEMPAMQAIAQSNPDDVVVLAVNRGDTAAKAKSFAAENDYDFVWALDEDGSIQSLYPARGIPYTVIIGRDGIITEIFDGGGPNMYPYFEEAITLAKE